jgi:hypothetical protein
VTTSHAPTPSIAATIATDTPANRRDSWNLNGIAHDLQGVLEPNRSAGGPASVAALPR